MAATDVSALAETFANLDTEVIRAVLEDLGGNVDRAAEVLLQFSIEEGSRSNGTASTKHEAACCSDSAANGGSITEQQQQINHDAALAADLQAQILAGQQYGNRPEDWFARAGDQGGVGTSTSSEDPITELRDAFLAVGSTISETLQQWAGSLSSWLQEPAEEDRETSLGSPRHTISDLAVGVGGMDPVGMGSPLHHRPAVEGASNPHSAGGSHIFEDKKDR